jgi:hypothetical protein
MAGLVGNWTKTLAVAVLLIGAGTVCFAQSARTRSVEDGPTGSLSGKLTDLRSKPLAGISVVVRNQATGVEARTITTKSGVYRFTGLAPGEYSVTAESPQLGRGQVQDIVVDGGHEARVQAAMELLPLPPSSLQAASPVQERPKVVELPRQSRTALNPEALPVSDAALAAEPLLLLPLYGHGVKAEISLPSAIEVNAALEIGPLLTLDLAGRSLPVFAPPAAVTSAPVAMASASTPPGTNGAGQAASGAAPPPPHPPEPATAAAIGSPAAVQAPRKPAPAASQVSEPAAPVSSSTMSAAELQALPVSGRRWQDFMLDNTPTSTTQAAGQGEILLRGAGQPAEIAVDGVGRGLAFGPTNTSGQGSQGRGPLGHGENPAGMAQVGKGGHGLAVSEAAIRAVETAAGNVEAAASRAAGGRMNVETERGANELHGQGFFFDRQNAWGARNPFTQWVKETTPATDTTVPVFTPESYTPPDHETTWGIGVGSRILRNKLFWFAALDGYRRNDPGLATVKHPYLCANASCSTQTGFFAPPTNTPTDEMQVLSSRLELSSANPVAEGWAAYSCMLETLSGTSSGSSPNCPSGWPLVGLLGPAPRTATQWTGFGRLDWQATERNRFTLEGIGARWNSPGGGLTRVAETYGNHSFGSSKASEEWLLGRWEAFLTPNLLAVTQVSAGRDILEARPETPSTYEQTLLSGNLWGQLPEIVVDNRYGFTIGNPSRFGQGSYPDEHLYHGQESVDWIRGKLLVKAGFEVSHNADATSLLRNQTGTYTYSKVENFISDALVFSKFGLTDALDPYNPNQHNCDETGKVWRDSGGGLRGVGYLPCYSYYSQTMGPAGWHLSTNDWAGYATAQWEPNKRVVLSAGVRWEREQRPPPIAALSNPELPLTESLPALGNNTGPRLGLAVGTGEKHWPVLRLGYGMYFGRTENLALETALTQTGSLNGDLSFFMRPTDNLNAGGAPPFPYVLQGKPGSVVKPGAVEFAGIFRNPEIHQAIVGLEEWLPGHVEVTASAMVSLGRRLPISIDTNFDSAANPGTITYAVNDATGAGPIKTTQITVPFYASWPSATSTSGFAGRLNPDYQQITQIMSRANSTYEAWMVKAVRYSRRGLSLRAHYTYAHAMDWNPNESAQVAGNDVLDPANFSLEYGTSNLDARHSASVLVVYETPWKLSGTAGKLGNGWMVSGVGQFRSGLPYTMHVSGSLPECFVSPGGTACTTFYPELNATSGAVIVGLGPGMNGSGGDNRVYNVGRNTYRYPATWKADLRLGRRFDLGHMRQLELLAEIFNLFNHQNVTEVETTGYYIESGSASSPFPSLNFLTGPLAGANGTILHPNSTAFGQPLNINATNFFRERQIQLGLRLRF